jgi:hypothetical protein
MLLHRHVAAVNVYDVCEALKRVERNTDGQHDVERGERTGSETSASASATAPVKKLKYLKKTE